MSTTVLVVSSHDESIYAPQALRVGASGYVTKEEPTQTLLSAFRKVLAGGIYLSPSMEKKVMLRVIRGAPALDRARCCRGA